MMPPRMQATAPGAGAQVIRQPPPPFLRQWSLHSVPCPTCPSRPRLLVPSTSFPLLPSNSHPLCPPWAEPLDSMVPLFPSSSVIHCHSNPPVLMEDGSSQAIPSLCLILDTILAGVCSHTDDTVLCPQLSSWCPQPLLLHRHPGHAGPLLLPDPRTSSLLLCSLMRLLHLTEPPGTWVVPSHSKSMSQASKELGPCAAAPSPTTFLRSQVIKKEKPTHIVPIFSPRNKATFIIRFGALCTRK
ncbi:uncharacterized protein [Gorilla gorilla gorilla]|uniref:uncharacterized protein n=1 Tax=Gorilla gorilla gorilla TaxID=9595 RepID=UPI0024464D5F|nr:uncharacterized protein LOC109023882 [Gorilla gorilla gorilla]